MRELPTRKLNRLKGYDYSQDGAYFVTVCTKDRAELFGTIVGAATCRPYVKLTEIGKFVDDAIGKINDIYEHVSVGQYVIMPNHVHIIVIVARKSGRQIATPTISLIVGNLKRAVSIRAGFSPWQKSFMITSFVAKLNTTKSLITLSATPCYGMTIAFTQNNYLHPLFTTKNTKVTKE